jgi:hypothetical protein
VERVGGVREDLQRGDQPGGTSSGWATAVSRNGVGVGLGAVVHQVQAGAGRQPAQPFLEVRELEPGREEPGAWAP